MIVNVVKRVVKLVDWFLEVLMTAFTDFSVA